MGYFLYNFSMFKVCFKHHQQCQAMTKNHKKRTSDNNFVVKKSRLKKVNKSLTVKKGRKKGFIQGWHGLLNIDLF